MGVPFNESKKGSYLSDRILRYKEFRLKMSEFGKDGADKRWGGHR